MIYSSLRLTYVPRWVIVPMRRQQSVAEHSFRVAIIAGCLAREVGFERAAQDHIISEALLHDSSEAFSGDIPRTYKKSGALGLYKVQKASGPHEAIVKVADLLEATEWVRLWGVGRRIPGIIRDLEKDLTEAVDAAIHYIPEFEHAYKRVCTLIAEEE